MVLRLFEVWSTWRESGWFRVILHFAQNNANNIPRMTALIASLVKSAMSGSIAHATASHKTKQRKTTSISFVETAFAEKKMQRSPRLPLSSSTLGHLLPHLHRRPKKLVRSLMKQRSASLDRMESICLL